MKRNMIVLSVLAAGLGAGCGDDFPAIGGNGGGTPSSGGQGAGAGPQEGGGGSTPSTVCVLDESTLDNCTLE